jgi:hypothetical protein
MLTLEPVGYAISNYQVITDALHHKIKISTLPYPCCWISDGNIAGETFVKEVTKCSLLIWSNHKHT